MKTYGFYTKMQATEQVAIGHVDRAADLIAAGLVERAKQKLGKDTRCAYEVMVAKSGIIVAGESNYIPTVKDVQDVWHKVYNNYHGWVEDYDLSDSRITIKVNPQSKEISALVDKQKNVGAGDQGMMFARPSLNPLFVKINKIRDKFEELAGLFINNGNGIGLGTDAKFYYDGNWDGKSRVHVSYESIDGKHVKDAEDRLTAVAIKEFGEKIITTYTPFKVAGAFSDTGMTGRNLACDTFGGFCLNGGGAIYGKDWTKVDFSGKVWAWHIAKEIYASLSKEYKGVTLWVQLSFSIGDTRPSVIVKTSTSTKEDQYVNHIEWDTAVMNVVKRHEVLTLKEAINKYSIANIDQVEACKKGLFR